MANHTRTKRFQPWIGWLLLGSLSISSLPAQAEPRPTLRVLTYNIHHGEGTDGQFDYQRVAKIINELNPDIVALQEVDHQTLRASGIDQAAHLGELTRMHHVFGKAMHYSGGGYGEAILSRFPMNDVRDLQLPFRFGQESRIVLRVTVKPDNGLPELLFAGTHLCHQSDETRVEQVQQINRLFQARQGRPVILAGDLNARPGSAPMQTLLQDRWVDAIAPKSRIDYILYRRSDPWKIVDVRIVDDRVASDHRPVLAVLEWHGTEAIPDSEASAAGREGELPQGDSPASIDPIRLRETWRGRWKVARCAPAPCGLDVAR